MFYYAQHTPPPDLRQWVRFIWTMAVDGDQENAAPAADAELVVPDGHAEIIFNLGDAFHQRAPGHDAYREQPSAILNGQLRSAVSLRASGRIQLVGIRLQPWALGALTREPAASLTDHWLPTSSVSSHLLPNLEEELRHANSYHAAPRIVVRHLRAQLSGRKAPPERAVTVVNQVAQYASRLDLSVIRNDIGINERALQRLFESEVGLSPKQFAKVIRVQQAVRLRREDESANWARAALEGGYYDQSHFNKDFRAVVGCAPTELMLEPETFTASLLATSDDS